MKILKSFEFGESTVGRAIYEWDKILTGKIVQLEEGKDYTVNSDTVRALCYSQARRRGLRVKVAAVENGLVIQSQPMSKDELAERDRQDAKKAAEKKAAKKAAEAGTEQE
jgi:hypothetical protein